MKSNFAKCLPEILKHEGGWADHPADPGGATMKGITIGTYRQWKGRAVSKAELRAISDAEVAAAMRQLFETTHQVAEGAGAAALAAAWQERGRLAGQKTAVVLSGGNVDRDVFAGVLSGSLFQE